MPACPHSSFGAQCQTSLSTAQVLDIAPSSAFQDCSWQLACQHCWRRTETRSASSRQSWDPRFSAWQRQRRPSCQPGGRRAAAMVAAHPASPSGPRGDRCVAVTLRFVKYSFASAGCVKSILSFGLVLAVSGAFS